MRRLAACVIASLLLAAPAVAQQQPTTRLADFLRDRLDAQTRLALGVQSLTVLPDGAASDIQLSRSAGSTEKTGLLLGQLGTGFTWSEDFPLYLEGYLGYARYNPRFVLTRDEESRRLSVAWNSVSATVGVGWSFAVTDRLQIRPVVNASLGYVSNDLALGAELLEFLTGIDLEFLKQAQAATGGIGGAIVLAWYDYRAAWEFEVEVRLSQMNLRTLPVYSRGLDVRENTRTATLWARYRVPIGWEAWGRPVRWVFETYHTEFLTDTQKRVLGADRLTRLGTGIEVDVGRWELGAFGINLNRVRLMGNVITGEGISGYSVGIGMSF
ncbi:hypothetical protein [Falsiroseomonas oryziterrae]|uniref:hypothetical protein n=1 Tax=Falsiroseomonas oryziterrae TaxID=2911368 RepID=UPI001F2A852C|nr:hypothetical protein [Roseomonas sp. NPKOSM-4]